MTKVYTKNKCKICTEVYTEEQRKAMSIENIKEEIGLCCLHKYMLELQICSMKAKIITDIIKKGRIENEQTV